MSKKGKHLNVQRFILKLSMQQHTVNVWRFTPFHIYPSQQPCAHTDLNHKTGIHDAEANEDDTLSGLACMVHLGRFSREGRPPEDMWLEAGWWLQPVADQGEALL